MTVSIEFLSAADKPSGRAGVIVVLRHDAALSPSGQALDQQSQGAVSRACTSPRLKGRPGEIIDLFAPAGSSARRIIVLELGKAAELTALAVTKAGAELAKHLESEDEPQVLLHADAIARAALPSGEIFARLVLGMRLRNYRFALMPKADSAFNISLRIFGDGIDGAALDRLLAVAEGVDLARTLVNYPANYLHPDNFGSYLEPLREAGIVVEELSPADLERMGAGALLAVGQGSDRKSRLFTLTYKGEGVVGKPLALVGKGMCFDSGGMIIKLGAPMFGMKADMSGAAAVIGCMLALARQKARVHVVGVLAVAENMLNGNSYKPGDIITTLSGRTVEVYDTDCEGRMVLSDALHYAASRFDPSAIIDLATLTYSVIQGLGHVFAGLFATHDELANPLLAAGEKTGERFWRLPLDADYDGELRSEIADLRQHARELVEGDAPFAAAFLRHFTEGRPWLHLDIAGKALIDEDRLLARRGASGFGVQLLEEWIHSAAGELARLG